jgi:4-aminobutyrate aminotransferase
MTTLTDRKNAAISRGVGMTTQIYADRAENAEIWDKDGNRYIDFAAGIAVVNTGHRHPRVIRRSRTSSTASPIPAIRSCPMKTMSRWPSG